jgi:xanthine dehydrogenase accessory factor
MGVLEQAALRQAKGQTFAIATVVRTVSVTAAKAGAKALIGLDGSIEEGWIGGGCARGGRQGRAPVHGGRPVTTRLDRTERRAC